MTPSGGTRSHNSPAFAASVPGKPARKRDESSQPGPIDTPAPLKRRSDQSGGFQQLQMLDNRRARDRQVARELTGAHRRARQSLKNDHPDRVAKHCEYSQHLSELNRACMGLCHAGSVSLD